MSNIDLSIIIPFFNVEEWIEECLSSVLDIDDDIHYEVILVNDGSTDTTTVIVDRFIAKYPTIFSIIEQHNLGMSAARNAGLQQAKGQFISFIDSDDFIAPKKYSKFFRYAKEKQFDILVGNAEAVWGEGFQQKKLLNKSMYHITEALPGIDFFQQFLALGNTNIVVWDKVFKTSILQEANIAFLDGLIHEDVPFNFDAYLAASSVGFLNIPFYYYRQRSGSIMHTLDDRSANSRLLIVKRMLRVFNDSNINIKQFNDYLVYQLKRTWDGAKRKDKQSVQSLLGKRLSLKKRLQCFALLFI